MTFRRPPRFGRTYTLRTTMAGLFKHLLTVSVCIVVFHENKNAKLIVEAKDCRQVETRETAGSDVERPADVEALSAELRRELSSGGADLSALERHVEALEDREEVVASGGTAARASTPSPERKEALGRALLAAAEEGRADDVRRLLEQGADVDARGEFGKTPLQYAARDGRLEAVEVLLKAGAPVDTANNGAQTPLHYASGFGHVEVIPALVAAGANLEARDFEKWTPLHFAAYYNRPSVVRVLLSLGADRTVKDKYGKTPIDYAEDHAAKALL